MQKMLQNVDNSTIIESNIASNSETVVVRNYYFPKSSHQAHPYSKCPKIIMPCSRIFTIASIDVHENI